MRRRFPPASRRTHFVCLLFALWVLARIGYDWFAWRWRDTTIESLKEGDYEVVRTVDAYTLDLTPAGAVGAGHGRKRPSQRARVRLIGITSLYPPSNRRRLDIDQDRVAKWQNAATAFTIRFVSGRRVSLRLDRRRIDHDRVFLAYIFLGNRMLNAELVRAGYARMDTKPGDSPTMVRLLREAKAEALQERPHVRSKRPS